METVSDLSNTALCCNQPSCKHKLGGREEALVIPDSPPLQVSLAGLIRYPYLSCNNAKPTAYVDVFVDDFWGLAKGYSHRWRYTRCTLFHELYKVFQPIYPADTANRKEVLSLKNI